MKKFLTLFAIILFISVNTASAKVYPGAESDVYNPPLAPLRDNVNVTSTDGKVILSVVIWGVTDGRGNDKDGLEQAEGKEVLLHSKYLASKGKNDIVDKTIVKDGIASFIFDNPSIKLLDGQKGFRERFWMSCGNNWAYIPIDSEYTVIDAQQNPGLEFIFEGNEIYSVPPGWVSDIPTKFGAAPVEIYGQDFLTEKKVKGYKK